MCFTEAGRLKLMEVSKMNMNDIFVAHKCSMYNRAQLLNDQVCGCFYCLKIFSPKDITEWVNEGPGTALCPYCGMDSVISESSGFPITDEFLQAMNKHWFA